MERSLSNLVSGTGTGQSEGDYKDATITRWAEDTAKVVDWLAEEHDQDQVVLVGAGVGGWVMLHTAQMRPDSVMGLVGVAADPDFTETLIRPALAERNPEVLAEIESKGIADFDWAGKPYTMTKNLLDDGKRMMVLNKGTKGIPITCPVRLIQGLGDEEIPPESALKIADCLEGEDVVITYVKYGRHALEEDDADFQRIYTCIEDLERAVQRANYMINMIRPV
jgi:pimeloyl-ACP methyl ester carboxylesterase